MQAGADRLDFAPPNTPGRWRALILALVVHGLLLAGLTWSVRWKHDPQELSADAELWSAVPAEAAPKLVELPPEPEQPEPPVPPTPPAPPPPPQPVVTPPAPPPPQVDIALEQEKQRLKKEQARLEELKQEKLRQKLEKEREDKLEKARLEKLKQDKLKQEQVKQEKLKAEQDKLKAEQVAKAQQNAVDKKKAEQEAKQLEAQRNKQLQRVLGMAGASGGANATGTALKSSGPSASYGGKIRATVKPKIVFTDDIQGNPTTEVEVRAAPDGTIVGRKITKSSGVKEWDEAVIRAIDKTEVLPRDIDGSMPSSLILVFRPKD